MSDDHMAITCARCGDEVKPFGSMRHSFVDLNFQPICVQCARELTPEVVAEAEEMNRQWGPNDNEDG